MKPTFPALVLILIGSVLVYAGIRGWSGTPELELPAAEGQSKIIQGDVYR